MNVSHFDVSDVRGNITGPYHAGYVAAKLADLTWKPEEINIRPATAPETDPWKCPYDFPDLYAEIQRLRAAKTKTLATGCATLIALTIALAIGIGLAFAWHFHVGGK